MDLERLRELLKIVAESGVAEVEIEEEDFKLVIRKNAPAIVMQPASLPYPMYAMPQALPSPTVVPTAPAPVAPAPQAPPAPETPPAVTPNQSTSDGASVVTKAKTHVVRAPIVGTFYRAPSPDADPFVEVGDRVKPGDVLCIIEAMKLMNEIESEVAGVVKEILVENGQPVEYDQPLFVIALD
ncbi:acetyl-CoA carboxylase biotin carboxyl carrier protein [Rhodothermus bifroesti]|uniref:Biotin carboxyl carrier protein of acetyl-CoA carboxylase n=1 Tax=Rhodothermus marinus TaxID=29549 RepID=A0A7V2F6U1_RHOMR|nr:acetyl-CoA carboxylase biotin carboxyl carrier protein [Rhodothermus bifroesti]GBD01487.1 Biotin carboxyl carrier protein of acetyl-CoA carboxylase [bacterium HR18]